VVAWLAALVAVVSLPLSPHGAHGVVGTVTLAPVTAQTTRVTVSLRVHDAKLRPVHIHGGRCGSFFGLPFGAFTMRGARGSHVVHASVAELLSGSYAIDVHAGVGAPDWITCANLRR
jgi:hypothetical protein